MTSKLFILLSTLSKMKSINKKWLLVAIALLIAPIASAYDFEVDGIYYNKLSDGKSVEVTYYYLDEDWIPVNPYSGSVTIPSQVAKDGITYTVSAIGNSAFESCGDLTYVSIPNTVTSIGWDAFYCCTSLTSVSIPNSVTSIGVRAFNGCSGLTSVTIGNAVTSIGERAFDGCTGLNKVIIEDLEAWCKIDFSGEEANPLYYAHHLYLDDNEVTELLIPNTVSSISAFAFYNCTGLTSVTIPNSVTSIGGFAFHNTPFYNNQPEGVVYLGRVLYKYKGTMDSNTTFKILEGTLSISPYAFEGYTDLVDIEIPNSIISIGDKAFKGCSGLNSVIIPNSVTEIGDFAFYGCEGLKSLEIGSSVTSIGIQAFLNCSGLTSLTIPNSVTTICNGAFSGCSSITSLTIGNSVSSIGWHAFSGCSGLTSVTIPNSVTSIGDNAFYYCTGLIKSAYPDKFSSNPFSSGIAIAYPSDGVIDSDGTIYNNDKTSLLFVPYNVTKYSIQNSITSIGDYAFFGCSGLTSMTIPSSVAKIGKEIFSGCTGLTSVKYNATNCSVSSTWIGDVTTISSFEIGEGVESIPDYLCKNITGITSMTIPNSIISIGNDAFYGCTGLISVSIPKFVTSIGDYAFRSCSSLTKVEYNAINCNVSDGWISDAKDLSSFEIGEGVERIPSYLCKDFKYLTSVKIPKTVTSIGYKPFDGCDGLIKSAYPAHIVNPFSNGIAIAYPSNGKIEPDGTIYNNDYTSLYFVPYDVEEFVIPGTVSEIGENAFACCSDLINLTSYALVPPTCGNNALEDINKTNCTLFVPEASIGQYKAADQWKDFYSFGVSGIEDIVVDADTSDEPIEYYNIQGIRIENPTTGVYIRRQGSSTTKVTIK